MSNLKGQEVLNKVISQMPKESREMLMQDGQPMTFGAELFSVMNDYPSVKNAFINTLTNKVTKTLIYSKVYNNPLKEIKKGGLDYGDTIEQVFVRLATVKNFGEHWDGGTTDEADLIRKITPKITALYIKKNVDKKAKTTVFDKEMKKAFMSANGFSNFIVSVISSITNAMEYQEYILTKQNLVALYTEGKQIIDSPTTSGTGEEGTTLANIPSGTTGAIKQTPYFVQIDGTLTKAEQGKQITESIKRLIGEMKFMKDKYNLAKEKTFSSADDLILVTTPSTNAMLDVHVLASAFNMDKASIHTKTLEVDTLPNGLFTVGADGSTVSEQPQDLSSVSNPTLIKDTKIEPLAILMDKDLLQIWDTDQGVGTFWNAEGKYTNHFANRESIYATCLFANMVVIGKKKS